MGIKHAMREYTWLKWRPYGDHNRGKKGTLSKEASLSEKTISKGKCLHWPLGLFPSVTQIPIRGNNKIADHFSSNLIREKENVAHIL